MSTTRNTPDRTAVVVAGLVAVAFIAASTIVALTIAIPDSQNPATIVVLVLGFFSTIAAGIGALVVGKAANEKLDRVLNGEMDAKIKRNVHHVLDEREPSRAIQFVEPETTETTT